MSRHPLLLVAAATLALGVGCAADAEPVGCAEQAAVGVEAGDAVHLFDGHAMRWQELAHRVAFVQAGVGVDDDGLPTADLGLVGGSWSTGEEYSDAVSWRLPWRSLQSETVSARHGAVAVDVGPEGWGSTPVDLEIDPEVLDGAAVAVALRGFCFDTDQPLQEGSPQPYAGGQGWTPQRLGAGVTAPQTGRRSVSFDVRAALHAGGHDRVDMNNASHQARIRAVVSWTVLIATGGEVTPGAVDAKEVHALRGDSYTPVEPLGGGDGLGLSIEGRPGIPTAVPLLRSFDFTLNPGERFPGRYLRSWSARIDDFGYDPDTGVAEVGLLAWMSSSSLLQEADLDVRFHADVDLLQLADPKPVRDRGEAAGDGQLPGAWSQPLD